MNEESNKLPEGVRETLVTAAEIMCINATECAENARAQLARLRGARTYAEAAIAGQKVFCWIEHIEEEKKTADSRFMNLLGRMWEFD